MNKIGFNYYAKEEDFSQDRESLNEGDIAFVGDSRKLSTHGHDYRTVTWGKKLTVPYGYIELTYYHGIDSIEVNGKNYYPDFSKASRIDVFQPGYINYTTVTYDPPVFTIKVRAGQINWKVNFKPGFKQNSGSAEGSTNLREGDTVRVSVPTTYIQIPIRIVKNGGVSSITITTVDGNFTSDRSVDYGSLVTWTVTLLNGYGLISGKLSGSFVATNPNGYDIGADLTTQIRQCPIRLQFHPGVESITVDGIEHFASELEPTNSLLYVEINPRVNYIDVTYDPMEKIIYTDYTTSRQWTAKAKEGWTLSSSQGTVNATGKIYTIGPVANNLILKNIYI